MEESVVVKSKSGRDNALDKSRPTPIKVSEINANEPRIVLPAVSLIEY